MPEPEPTPTTASPRLAAANAALRAAAAEGGTFRGRALQDAGCGVGTSGPFVMIFHRYADGESSVSAVRADDLTVGFVSAGIPPGRMTFERLSGVRDEAEGSAVVEIAGRTHFVLGAISDSDSESLESVTFDAPMERVPAAEAVAIGVAATLAQFFRGVGRS